MKLNPLTLIDFYKADHRRQYPDKTEYVYSNWTPRSTHLIKGQMLNDYDDKIVVIGLYSHIRWFIVDLWNEGFFKKPKEEVVAAYKHRMDTSLGTDAVSMEHIAELHDLGYMPLHIKGLKEGSRVNVRVPHFTIVNTKPEFFWLVNYLESVMSSESWKISTTATLAYEYKRLLDLYAERTGVDPSFVGIQGHDFAFRGMSGVHDVGMAGHLSSFIGTDSVPAIDYLENYMNADATKAPIGVSVFATEHSVMSLGTKESELDTYERLITKLYPNGIISIVSDTWDFWKVLMEYTPLLKDKILARGNDALGNSKVVFRPDSGDPVKIIVGDPAAKKGTPAYKGAVECLWEVFGGTVTEKGYKELNSKVGLIYGDSITIKRARQILAGLEAKGFASSNIVLGIGSYTYQFLTRDSLGFAMKATWGMVDGEARAIFKDPVTDSGIKKSAKGLLKVTKVGSDYILKDECTVAEETEGLLETVFINGKIVRHTSLEDVRNTLANEK